MEIGFVGLGKMGKNMVTRLLGKSVRVVVWNRSKEPVAQFAGQGAVAADNLKELINKLKTPRLIWLMLPAGSVVDQVLDELLKWVSSGDLIIDGGNSFYKDSIRRQVKLAKKKIRFMDVGVSGGPGGALSGACLMIGGAKEDFLRAGPLFKILALPGAFSYFGEVGAGHFAKMVHNGIEYGMMEAIAEGANLLKKSPFKFDLEKVFKLYNNGSVIESRLVGWTAEALAENPDLKGVTDQIAASGEGEWSVKQAGEEKIAVPVIEAALKVRQDSKAQVVNKADSFRNKVVSAQRGKFGQHKVNV